MTVATLDVASCTPLFDTIPADWQQWWSRWTSPDGLLEDLTDEAVTPVHTPIPLNGPDRLLALAHDAGPARLRLLVEELLQTPRDERVTILLKRVAEGARSVGSVAEMLRIKPGIAIAEALRMFPGPITRPLIGVEHDVADIEEIAPLTRLLLRMGPQACALAIAHGEKHPSAEARYVALLLARDNPAPAIAWLVAQRLGDPELRVAWLAAVVLRRMLNRSGGAASTRAFVLPPLRLALESGTPAQREGALRAAAVLGEMSFVPALIGLLNCVEEDVRDAALHALRETTGQDFAARPRKWKRWWAERCGAGVQG